MESVSYSLGILVAQNLKNQGFKDINIEEFGAAIDDVLQDRETKVDVTQANETVQQYMQAAKAAQHKDNKDAGEAFLAENKLRGEVVTTDSGLQYEVLTEGEGSKPKATDEVEVHYHGTLIDGTVFDSSVQRGETTSFPLNRVISGWTEGLQLMSVGSKYKFYIPYNLAYGDQGAGAQIKPFSALVFEVELISIK
ncbi:MAG: FKBP-type peptidyl-prolyl cis-trans isomerase [Bacteroidota bacterium]